MNKIMKRILLLFSTVLFAFSLSAQNYDNYLQKAFEHLEQGNVSTAKQAYGVYQTMTDKRNILFENSIISKIKNNIDLLIKQGHLGDAYNNLISEKQSVEYNSDLIAMLEVVKSEINTTYNNANRLRTRQAADSLELAIIEYRKLIGTGKPNIHCYIGLCNEKLNRFTPAKEEYINGVQEGESYAPYCLAQLDRITDAKIPIDSLASLYLYSANAGYVAAIDSLAMIYKNQNKPDKSYFWLRKSQSAMSKYYMASYLLDKSTSCKLSDEYKTDDPIKLLVESAERGYAPAQYYLGLLYYYAKDGERVQRDKAKGMELMQKASSKYAPAKKMISRIIYEY